MVAQITLLVFGTVFALFMATYLGRAARRERRQDALLRRLGAMAHDEASLLRTDAATEAERSALLKLLAESGLGWTAAALVARMIGAAVLGALLGLVLGSFALALLFAIAGALAFPLLARRARTRRLALCDQQMPQALEVMSLALRAGHPLPTSLAIAAAEAPSPIADELRRAVDEHELGRPIGDVLIALGKRLPGSEAVHTFVVAVLVLQQTGGNLISVIDRIVENARARSQYRAKLRALTSEGRMSAKMLGVMPLAFGVLAAAADPNYAATLLSTASGNMILLVAGVLWALGLVWTRKLVETEA